MIKACGAFDISELNSYIKSTEERNELSRTFNFASTEIGSERWNAGLAKNSFGLPPSVQAVQLKGSAECVSHLVPFEIHKRLRLHLMQYDPLEVADIQFLKRQIERVSDDLASIRKNIPLDLHSVVFKNSGDEYNAK